MPNVSLRLSLKALPRPVREVSQRRPVVRLPSIGPATATWALRPPGNPLLIASSGRHLLRKVPSPCPPEDPGLLKPQESTTA